MDYGSWFAGRVFDLWAYHRDAATDLNRPGKPTEHCVNETSSRSLRGKCPNVYRFKKIDEVRTEFEAWRKEHNESRSDQALSEQISSEFAVQARHLSTSGVIRGAET